MTRNAELVGIVRPQVDERAAEREASRLGQTFEKATTLTPNVDVQSLRRKLERAIPGGGLLGTAVDAVVGGGGGGRTAGQGDGDTSQTALLSAQLETLDDIHETLEKQALTGDGGGGGGGLASTVLKYAGLRSILKGGGGVLSTLSGAAGTAAGAAMGLGGVAGAAVGLGALGTAGGLEQLEQQGLLQDSGVPDILAGKPPWWNARPTWLERTPEWWSRSVPALQETPPGQNINPNMAEVKRRARQIRAAQSLRETSPGQNINPNMEVVDNITSNNYGRADQQGNFQSDQLLFNRAQANRRQNRAAQKKAQGTTINVDVGRIVAEVSNQIDGRQIESAIERKVEEYLGRELENLQP